MTSDESSISTQNPVNIGSNIPPLPPPPPQKKKRNLPGTPDPDAEVIGLSPKTLMATNRFLCEICGKGFQRDQNLQLHRRGHNLPWKLKQRATGSEVRKRVYICPEKTCVHHHPSRALGDLTGIKKHFCRKHGDKKWKCDKCSKRYAVQSDWKAHSKTCGTREYKCHCGTIFSRRDSFITHRAFCDALAQETARVTAAATHHHNHNHNMNNAAAPNLSYQYFLGPPSLGMMPQLQVHLPSLDLFKTTNDDQNLLHDPFPMAMGRGPAIFSHEPTHSTSKNPPETHLPAAFTTTTTATSFSNLPVASTYYNVMNWDFGQKFPGQDHPEMANNSSSSSIPVTFKEVSVPSLFSSHENEGNNDQERATATARMSATALLQKAAQIGATTSDPAAMILGTSSSSSFGMIKCNNINIINNNNAAAAVHDKLQAQVLCGLYSTSSCCSSDDVERSSANEMISINQQQMMYSASKRRRIQNIHDEEVICTEGGETRDFLGVGHGINSICHPSSINGIAWL